MPLSDDAMAIRGGKVRDAGTIRESILKAVAAGAGPVYSVFCADAQNGESREDLMRRICVEAPVVHTKIQVGTTGGLRAVLSDLVQDTSRGQAECHYHAVFADGVPLLQVQAFVDALGEPEPNPTGGRP